MSRMSIIRVNTFNSLHQGRSGLNGAQCAATRTSSRSICSLQAEPGIGHSGVNVCSAMASKPSSQRRQQGSGITSLGRDVVTTFATALVRNSAQTRLKVRQRSTLIFYTRSFENHGYVRLVLRVLNMIRFPCQVSSWCLLSITKPQVVARPQPLVAACPAALDVEPYGLDVYDVTASSRQFLAYEYIFLCFDLDIFK